MAELLAYWAEEPPTHVILAARYLGDRKKAKVVDEAQARQQLGEAGQFLGMQPAPLPGNVREMVQWAERMKREKKGLSPIGV